MQPATPSTQARHRVHSLVFWTLLIVIVAAFSVDTLSLSLGRSQPVLQEPWRLVMAHFAHWNALHLLANASLWLLVCLVARRLVSPSALISGVLLSIALLSAFLALNPVAYAGASAWLWAVMTWLLLELASRSRRLGGSSPDRLAVMLAVGLLHLHLASPWLDVLLSFDDGDGYPWHPLLGIRVHGWAHLAALLAGWSLFVGRRVKALGLIGWGVGAALPMSLALAQTTGSLAGDPAAGRMLYRDTPVLRGSLNACIQCHPNPLTQQRGQSLFDQETHIRCAIQGGCPGSTTAVYPLGGMAQFQNRLSAQDIRHLAAFIRSPAVQAAYPVFPSYAIEWGSLALGQEGRILARFENRGEAHVTLKHFNVEGVAAQDYRVEPLSCVPGATLASGGSCEFALRFIPSCAAERQAMLTLEHNGPLAFSSLRLLGQGVGQGGRPSIVVTPTPDSVRIGQDPSLPDLAVLTVTNGCSGLLTIQSIATEGNLSIVAQQSTCDSARLSANERCQIAVRQSMPQSSLPGGPNTALAEPVGRVVIRHSASMGDFTVATLSLPVFQTVGQVDVAALPPQTGVDSRAAQPAESGSSVGSNLPSAGASPVADASAASGASGQVSAAGGLADPWALGALLALVCFLQIRKRL